MNHNHYARLLAMAALSFVAMYALMYAMVDSLGNVYNSLNQVYMAGLMTAPMMLIELALMGSMYQDKKLNLGIAVGSLLLLVGCWTGIRRQGGIRDQQFLRSMIPHHAGAILMCEQAAIRDPEIEDLCKSIRASQEAEIQQMKVKLAELKRRE